MIGTIQSIKYKMILSQSEWDTLLSIGPKEIFNTIVSLGGYEVVLADCLLFFTTPDALIHIKILRKLNDILK